MDNSTAANLSVLINRVKKELDVLVTMVGDMQTGLTPLLAERVVDDPDAFRHAQNLDLVWQTLESLSQVLHAVAQERVTHQPIDIDAIAHSLPLANLSARLRGVGHGEDVKTGDELDLF